MLKDRKINKYRGRLPAAIALFLLFCAPLFLFAQIEITEIMYNLEGDDDGPDGKQRREWIEIYNYSSKVINLKDWRFYEAKVNHYIKSVLEGDDAVLPINTYAVIADKPDVFEAEHPDFSGIIFDSVFSLSDTGETLIIRNAGLDIDEVSYSSNQGANGNGNSLQKINGEWSASVPTPGEANSQSAPDSQPVEENNPPTPPETSQTQDNDPISPVPEYIEPQISARIIPPTDTPIEGADFLFEAKAFGIQNRPLQNAKYQWTFGDGSKAEGQKVLHNYQYSGDYMVSLEVISGECSSSARLKMKVISSDISISELGTDFDNNFIELHNPSAYEINLSWWRLRADNNYWTIPKNTILLPKSRIKFSARISNLFPRENSQIQLLYPNGRLAFEYAETKKLVRIFLKKPSILL